MKYRVSIAMYDDRVEACVFDLPGCMATAATAHELHALLPIVIGEHLTWLQRHGEELNDALPIEPDVTEEIDVALADAADDEFCFADDRPPASEADIEVGIRRMSYARDDLLAVIEPLPDVVLDWRPLISAMAKIDTWNPDVHTIREIALDIANADGYYRNGLSGEPDDQQPDVHSGEKLGRERELTIARLRSLTPEERGALFRPTRAWQDRPEQWTARKAIRRIISHERFHTKEIEQRLAWLLLGVPEFRHARKESVKIEAT